VNLFPSYFPFDLRSINWYLLIRRFSVVFFSRVSRLFLSFLMEAVFFLCFDISSSP